MVKAAELPSSSYTLTTVPTINNNKLVDGAEYSEGNFTFDRTNSTTQQRWRMVTWFIKFRWIQIESDSTTEIFGNDGVT